MFWHALELKDLFTELKSSDSGLSEKEARKRLKIYGPNRVVEKEKISKLKILLNQFKGFLIYLLIFASLVSILVGEIRDAVLILLILILNGLLGFVQEYKAEKEMEALKELEVPTAKVIRDGKIKEISAEEIVPGDVILVEEGDRVPADARLIQAFDLYTDESLLTGESIPVLKSLGTLPEKLPVAERKNLLFLGTTVTRGRGKAIVFATGKKTEMGKIAKEIEEIEEEETPFKAELNRFGKKLGIFVLILCFIIFISYAYVAEFHTKEGLLQGIVDSMLISISLAVSAVPEGLPVVITLALAVGLKRMAEKNAIVRRLGSVETLGRVTVICTDKTGTLTKNEMTVRRIFCGEKFIDVTGYGFVPEGKLLIEGEEVKVEKELELLLKCATYCNNSILYKEMGEWKTRGDPTEIALKVLGAKAKIKGAVVGEKEEFERIDEIPFTSERKMMSTIHKISEKKFIVLTKGAPEVILKLCDRVMVNGRVRKISRNDIEKYLGVSKEFANSALRVLAFAYKITSSCSRKDAEKNLILLGLVGMIDPPRPEVFDAVKKCREAGIRVIMLTGDHRDTAVAIAKEIGMERLKVISGEEMDEMSDVDLENVLEECDIFARVTPQHKFRILNLLKKRNEIVAMTGDGVNDAPALKLADVGVAMGVKGTDVAKGASDIVLTDDNFSTIVTAVEEGRGVFERVKLFIKYLLSSNFDELMLILIATFMFLPTPLTPVQILWINLLTDGLPAISLGMLKTDPDIMKRPPRKMKGIIKPILGGLIVRFFMAFLIEAGLFFWLISLHWNLYYSGDPYTVGKVRSMVFSLCVFFELFFVFECQSDYKSLLSGLDKYVLLFTLISMGLQFLIISIPTIANYFGVVPLSLSEWLIILLLSFTIIPAEEIRKFFVRRRSKD